MDYLFGKLLDQTQVQIRTLSDQTLKTELYFFYIHYQHIAFVYHFWQTIALIYDKTSSIMQIDKWCKRIHVHLC